MTAARWLGFCYNFGQGRRQLEDKAQQGRLLFHESRKYLEVVQVANAQGLKGRG